MVRETRVGEATALPSAGSAPAQPDAKWLPLRASIIIVNYNGQDEVSPCLVSVMRSMPTESEAIVVDNASTDASAETIEHDFPHVRLIRSKTNLGFGGGNNVGAQAARGRFLVFLNPDTQVAEGGLAALLAPLEAEPHLGLVTAKILLAAQPDHINACGNTIHLTGLTLCRGMGLPKSAFDQAEEVDAISGAAFAIRRETFEALGGFDEDFFLYMEDTDLSWRARLAGWRCGYVPESIVLHHYTLRISPKKVFYQERNRYRMLLKSLRWPTLAVLLPALLLAEGVTWGFALWSDRANWGNKLHAYQAIVANWNSIMQKRKTTQALRRISDRELLRHTGFKLDFDQAARGSVVALARWVFDPLFFLLRSITLALVWW